MDLKAFAVEHPGKWLPGYSIVFAKDQEEAALLLRRLLSRAGIEYDEERIKFIELPLNRAEAWLIWDGDY